MSDLVNTVLPGMITTIWSAANTIMRLTRSRIVRAWLAALQIVVIAIAARHREDLTTSPYLGVTIAVVVGLSTLCPSMLLLFACSAVFIALVVAANYTTAVLLVVGVAAVTVVKLGTIVYNLLRCDVPGARRALGTIAWWQSMDIVNAAMCMVRDFIEWMDPAVGVKMRDAAVGASGVGTAPPSAPTARDGQGGHASPPPPMPAGPRSGLQK